jgi:hypothetical protein
VPVRVNLVALCTAFVLAGSAPYAAPAVPRFLCYPVMPGDTAAAVARRLTRDPQGWRGSHFQFLDPATTKFVPKSNYGNLHRGWQACIAEQVLVRRAPPPRMPDTMRWWVLVLVCGAAGASLLALQWSLEQRSAMSRTLETFGTAFIREFERPLLDDRSNGPSLRTRLALSPDKRTLEVLLAPAEGKRYPNLADHRANLEYDVRRVVSLLNDRRFACGPLRASGSWVAIPFQMVRSSVRLQPDRDKEGGA